MSGKPNYILRSHGLKILTAVTAAIIISGCSSTANTQNTDVVDQACAQYAADMQIHAETSGSSAQMLAAANAMDKCLVLPLPAQLNDNETEQVMKLMANTTLTYKKAGDLAQAQNTLTSFETQFPNQDLYLPNFTSFIDTATALLEGSTLSSEQLVSLNISRELRQEIERQQYWLKH